ncbi:hypothetical protein AB9E29_33855, partial [Rhizobium leguminosarum]
VIDILSFMDAPRQREVYLRIARAASISGKPELARMAVGRVQSLGGGSARDAYIHNCSLPSCARRPSISSSLDRLVV